MKIPSRKTILNSFLAIVFTVSCPAFAGQQNVTSEFLNPLEQDDITYSSNYLTNSQGDNYGGEFYLINNTDQTIRVQYWLEGSSNVDIKSDGGITDVPPNSKVWVITVLQAGPDAWSSGILHYKW